MDKATKAKARDKLRMLNSDQPHNGGGNICRGDGYFAQSIVRDFGMSLTELAKVCGYKSDAELDAAKSKRARKLATENAALKKELARIKACGRIIDRIEI